MIRNEAGKFIFLKFLKKTYIYLASVYHFQLRTALKYNPIIHFILFSRCNENCTYILWGDINTSLDISSILLREFRFFI